MYKMPFTWLNGKRMEIIYETTIVWLDDNKTQGVFSIGIRDTQALEKR
jgi:hypothetical protein